MPVKVKSTIDIVCRCKANTRVELEEAIGYIKITPFMCDCGRTFLIRDYVNAMTSYGEVEHKEYDEYLKNEAEDKKRKKIMNPTDEGRMKYQAVSKWLNSLSEKEVNDIEKQRTMFQVIEKDYVIETILEHCKHEDDLLDRLFLMSVSNIQFHASGDQAFTDKMDWYIMSIHDLRDGEISKSYDSKADVDIVIKALTDDPENYDVAYTSFAVPKGTKVSVPE